MSERQHSTSAASSPGASRNPRERPSDPAGTRPKVDPEELRPSTAFRALPPGQPAASEHEPLPATVATPSPAPPPVSPPAAVQPSIPRQSPHAPRFQFVFGMLGALAVATIAVAVSLALAPKSGPQTPWSAWKPSGDTDPAVQIAEHVAPEYTLSPGHELVSVTGGPQAIGGQPVVVALRNSGSSPAPLPENGVFYQLCGSGPNCSMPGKASNRRGLLVRREALELALYTFHYIETASQVVVTYPPPPSGKGSKSSSSSATESQIASIGEGTAHAPTRVLLFRPEDLAPELSRPLNETLSSVTPTIATVERFPEAGLVNSLTVPRVYFSTLIPQQTGEVLLLQAAGG